MTDPFVTVIMPVRNEEAIIARSLGAVLSQHYPPERVEALIADGQSDDHTREVIASLPGAERVRVIENPQRRQAFGLNLALRQARGDIIVRVDGHTIIAPDYVRQCVQALTESGAVNVGGRMEPYGATPVGRAIAAAGASRFGVPTAFHVSDTPQYTDTVYLGAWPRSALLAIGGFDERLRVNEDYELNYRLRQAGGRIYLSPAIRSTYFGRQTLGALARQYFAYGWDRTNTLKLHPGSLKLRQLVAPTFVAALLIGGALATVNVAARVAWVALLALYALANLLASAQVARRAGWEQFSRLPLVFATMHVAWGLGFWRGVLAGGALKRRGEEPARFDTQTQGGQ
ncbi:MAG TPA: glycosyltransferase family 2 protein [Ktedonobacterales bacterium]